MDNFDFKKYLAENKLIENTLKNDIKDFLDSIDIDNYQRSKDNDPDFENVDFDMEFFLDMYPEYAGKEEEIQQILNSKEDLSEETINEEAYDTVRDVRQALGSNPTQDQVEEYLGRSLDSDEMDAFGFQIAIGRKNGQPIYASKKPTRYPTYTRRRGDY